MQSNDQQHLIGRLLRPFTQFSFVFAGLGCKMQLRTACLAVVASIGIFPRSAAAAPSHRLPIDLRGSSRSLQLTPAPDFRASWFSGAGCSSTDAHTTVVAQQGYCHLLGSSMGARSDGGFAGYKLTCAAGNSNGTVSFCSDATCSSCSINTPFIPGACLDNPVDTGSASVRFDCGGGGAVQGGANGLECGRCEVTYFVSAAATPMQKSWPCCSVR